MSFREEFCTELKDLDSKLETKFQRALNAYDQWNEKRCLRKFLIESAALGSDREPTQHSFVVHPNYALGDVGLWIRLNYADDERAAYFPPTNLPFNQYRTRMIALLADEEKPIVISDATLRPSMKYNRSRGIKSAIQMSNRSRLRTLLGRVTIPCGVRKLSALLSGFNPEDNATFSGSDMTRCVSQLAEQYIALCFFGQAHPDVPFDDDENFPYDSIDPIRPEHRRDFLRGLEIMGLVRKRRLRYGDVFDVTNGERNLKNDTFPLQLIQRDEGSVIYPRDCHSVP